jgi:hypothetical protein
VLYVRVCEIGDLPGRLELVPPPLEVGFIHEAIEQAFAGELACDDTMRWSPPYVVFLEQLT